MGHIQEHPDYHAGFYDAAEGKALHAHASREYAEGYAAHQRAARLLDRLKRAA